MRASAALTTHLTTGGRTRIGTLRSQAPLMLRPTRPKGPEPWATGALGAVRVCLAAGAAGPIGGDEFGLAVEVGSGSTLVLRDISATLLLRGPHDEQSRMRTTARVGAGATLVWLPEPVIAAHGCHHHADVHIELHPDARLVVREELLLGRHGEQPGDVVQRLRVRRDGRPLLDQQLTVGPHAVGWDGPAVTGGRRAIGSLVVVDPTWGAHPPQPVLLGDDAVVLPLEGPAALVSALTPDALTLRRCLDAALGRLTGDCPEQPRIAQRASEER